MKFLSTFFVWLAMGIADLVPWVSGWTIAFIAWVYERLISSIYAIDKKLFHHIRKWSFTKARHHLDWNFLITLVWGIIISVFLWAIGLKTLLENYPTLVFSFFSWLILASSIWFLSKHFSLRYWWWAIVWAGIWRFITTVTWIGFPTTFLWFFFAWVLWSSAMILPWISWSYILLIVGMYEPVLWLITSVTSWDFTVIPLLICLFLWIWTWIIMLWRILKKLYSTYTSQLILCMTGLMLWALPSIFPMQWLIWSQHVFLAWTLIWWWALVFYGLTILSKKTHSELSTK